MKNTALYVVSGVALLGVAALVYIEVRRRKEQSALASNQQQVAASGVPIAMQKFKGFNFQLNLNSTTKQAVPEITALQHMINAYYDGSNKIPITGVWDADTRAALKSITDKTSTTLYEFMHEWLIKKRNEKVASDVITSITQTGE